MRDFFVSYGSSGVDNITDCNRFSPRELDRVTGYILGMGILSKSNIR